ncbi:g4418 [Coccomyxa elongata]
MVTKSKKPLVLLLNGASVESFWYQWVIEELAKKGFVIAASDYYRPFHYKTPILPRPGCRQDAIVDASARLINTLYDFIHNVTHGNNNAGKPSLTFLQRANLDQLLLLGHSLGGFVACDILSGGCETDSSITDSCEGYTPVLNTEGKDVVIGAVTFEGYLAGSGMKPQNISLAEKTFTLFLAGEYNKNAREAFIGARDSGSCVSYIAFHAMNHYGMNDFVSPHQVTPCAAPIPTDDPHFTTDAATQAAGVDLIAEIIDTTTYRMRGA